MMALRIYTSMGATMNKTMESSMWYLYTEPPNTHENCPLYELSIKLLYAMTDMASDMDYLSLFMVPLTKRLISPINQWLCS